MLAYPIELTPDDNDTLLATSPDFPQLTSFGQDAPNALARAACALEEAIASRMADKRDIPAPRAMQTGPEVRLSNRIGLKTILYQAMRDQGLSKAQLARRMGIARQSVDRLLRLNHSSRLDMLDAAFLALGREIFVTLRERAA